MIRLAALALLTCRPARTDTMRDDPDARSANIRARPAAQAFTAAARETVWLTGGLRAPPARFGERP